MTDRIAARAVGLLFIVATVAGIAAAALQLESGSVLDQAYLNEGRMATAALLELVMGVAIAAIAIVIYPILRRSSQRLALGYVVARSVETVLCGFSVIGALTVLTLSRNLADPGASGATLRPLSDAVLAARDHSNYTVVVIAFSLGALVLNAALFRARLVPRWLPTWGLAGAGLYLVAAVLVLYGLDPLSSTRVALVAPLGLQEMALALWLIFKGFDTHALPLEISRYQDGTAVARPSVGIPSS